MHQSGKFVAYCATALSAAAMLGVSAVFIGSAWIGPRLAGQSGTSYSEQAKSPAETPGLAEVRALAAAVAGPPPASQQLPAQAPAPTAVDPAMQSSEAAAPPPEWTPIEVGTALMECVTLLAPINAQVVPLAPVRQNDCGTAAPVLLRSIGTKDRIAFDPPLVMNCPMVAALSRWLEGTVQPAARAAFGAPVARITGSSYACRNLYNLPNERRSQHAYANAIDLPAFFLANGRIVNLIQGWGPTRRDMVAGVKLVPIVAKTPEGTDAGGVSTADMKTANGVAGGATVVKASVEQPVAAADAAAPKAAPLPDPPATPEAKFLRRVHRGACDVFSTVLGPEANDVHRTHLHLDLQDRNMLNVCH